LSLPGRESKRLAEARLRVAREFLADAKLCLDNGRFRSAASRSYYAVFHACIALFERFGYIPSNFRGRDGGPARRWEHRIVTLNFHIEFVQNKRTGYDIFVMVAPRECYPIKE